MKDGLCAPVRHSKSPPGPSIAHQEIASSRRYLHNQPVGHLLSIGVCLVGAIGILLDLTCIRISGLPSQTPLQTIMGLAPNRSLLGPDRSPPEFTLVEGTTGRHVSLLTVIDGPQGRPACSCDRHWPENRSRCHFGTVTCATEIIIRAPLKPRP